MVPFSYLLNLDEVSVDLIAPEARGPHGTLSIWKWTICVRQTMEGWLRSLLSLSKEWLALLYL